MAKNTSETRKSIKYSYLNGITDAVVKALTTGPLLSVYAVGIGMNNLSIGLLQSVLPFSNLIHLYVAKLLEKGASPRKIAWVSSLLARPFLLLIALSVLFKGSIIAILLFTIPYILTQVCNSFTSGAFWPWCKAFVPNKLMTSYFAYRTQYIIATKMITFLIVTGIIYLIHKYKPDFELYSYSIFYIFAFIAGVICTWALYKIKDVKLNGIPEKTFLTKVKNAFQNKSFCILFAGIGLANFVLSFYTSFNIVFLLKNLKIAVPFVMCFTLFSNVVEISIAQIWKKYSNKRNSSILVATSAIVFAFSVINFLILSIYPIQNPLYLTVFLIFTAILCGIGSSGFFIGTNSICVAYVPEKMSSVYLSLMNIGRFGLNGLGASCAGLLLQFTTNNNYQWVIFFGVCIILYVITSFFTAQMRPVKHIDNHLTIQ